MTTSTFSPPTKLFIAGQWVDGPNKVTVRNKYTGEIAHELSGAGPDEVNRAVAAAKQSSMGSRSYAGAANNRLNTDWTALNTSADSEILTSLRVLRSRSWGRPNRAKSWLKSRL